MSAIELQVIETQAQTIAARTALIAIVDAESFALAVEDRAEIKRRLARIGELMDPICDAAHKAWKTALGKRDVLRAPFMEADRAYARAMGTYEQEQAQRRREAEEAACRERERLAADERARVTAEQEQLRQDAMDRQLEAALAAEAAGDIETADRILAVPVEVPTVETRPVFVPPPAVEAPRAAGVSFRDAWSAEVTDLLALVKAIAGGQAPITLVKPDMGALARALKNGMRVPGVRAVSQRIAVQKSTT